MDRLAATVGRWLNEVQGDMEEAKRILASDMHDLWWADMIRHLLETSEGPSDTPHNKMETLLAIAFWSGWLKGEKDTLDGVMASCLTPYLPSAIDPGEIKGNAADIARRRDEFFKGLQ